MEIKKKLGRSEKIGFGEITRIAFAIKIPDYVKEEAVRLFSEAKEKHLLRERSIDAIAGACVSIACRIHKIPWIIEDIAENSNAPTKDIRRTSYALLQKLKITLLPLDASLFVPRFCSDLDLSAQVATETIEIIKRASKVGLTNGRNPITITAAAIYITAKLNDKDRTQEDISIVTGITEVTIRKRYKEMANKLNIDMPL